jgi:hypothetical protein
MAEQESWYWKNHKTIGYLLYAYIILGWIGYWYLYFTLEPWGPTLGVVDSPERLFWGCGVVMALIALPVQLWELWYFVDHPEWIARANMEEYVPGTRPKVWTRRRIITSAMGMALFGGSGAFYSPVLDVPGIIWQFLAVAYDPIVCWFAVAFGFLLIRGPLFAGMWNPFMLFGIWALDVAILNLNGLMWWRWWKPSYRKGKMNAFTLAILWTIIGMLVHAPAFYFTWSRFRTPEPALTATQWTNNWGNPWWILQFSAFKFIGVFMGLAVSKYTWRPPKEELGEIR